MRTGPKNLCGSTAALFLIIHGLKQIPMILFPYATGDFHSGTGEFHYTDKDGKEKILSHNGYVNYTAAMKQIMEKAGIQDADTVLVTGYSAGCPGSFSAPEQICC